MQTIKIVPWVYTLFSDKGRYFISVVCGTAANYDINLQLSDEEIKSFKADSNWLDTFTEDIRNQPHKYSQRHLDLFEPHKKD